MGFTVKIEGAEAVNLKEDSIRTLKFKTVIPLDSNARSTDMGSTMIITGKILAAVNGENSDDTMKLYNWSLVPAEKADCYRKVTVEVIAADQIVRKIYFPHAFVVDYREEYDDASGTGTFVLVVKQKKDKLPDLKIEGGYSA